jgi:proliferating cell nuclear antigen
MDKTQTLLVNVKLNAKKFDVFKVKKKVFDIGISLTQLYKSLKSLQKDDSLTISVNEDDKDWLMLKIKNEKKRYETSDKIKLMDINKSKYDIPSTAFDVVVTIDTEEFHTICKEMSHIQQVIEIKCTRKSLTFTSTGDSSERSKSYYPDENGIKINFSKDTKTDVVQGIFELKFLVMFTNKSQNLCPRIQLFMKNNYPLCVKFTVATLGKLLFCVSPYDEDRIAKEFDEDEEHYNEGNVDYLEDN